jgi:hypothetical protein
MYRFGIFYVIDENITRLRPTPSLPIPNSSLFCENCKICPEEKWGSVATSLRSNLYIEMQITQYKQISINISSMGVQCRWYSATISWSSVDVWTTGKRISEIKNVSNHFQVVQSPTTAVFMQFTQTTAISINIILYQRLKCQASRFCGQNAGTLNSERS